MSSQDVGRKALKFGYDCGRVNLNGVRSRRHHGGKGVDTRGGGNDLLITYSVAEMAKENSKKSEKK